MRPFIATVSAALLGIGTATAHDGPLDPRFGDGGMRNYGFQSFNGSGREDKATAVCPGPNGTLLVVGEASDARRIVTMRLLPNGDYDPSFGAAGRATLELPITREPFMAGLCLPGGKILLARRLRVDQNEEMNIQLLRIDANTGQLDPSFGQTGVVLLDLDAWQSGLARRESPFALVALDQGEALVLGQAGMGTRLVAFAARVGADGSVPLARVYADTAGRATANVMMTATLAGDGTIWGIVEGAQQGTSRVTPFRVRFDRTTLEWIDVPDPLPNATDPDIYAGLGVPVGRDTLAVPVMQAVAGTEPRRFVHAMMIFRPEGKVFVPLPAPELAGELLSAADTYARQQAVLLPGNRVLSAATLRRPGDAVTRAIHFALVEIGPRNGQDSVDTAFGVGGAQTAAFRPTGGSCTSALVEQWISGLTVWAGSPVFVGAADAGCSSGDGALDYLVGRIGVDRIFVAGFQSAP
jgi:hypothetical protein